MSNNGRYIAQLTDEIIELQEIIENIEASKIPDDEKRKALTSMIERYNYLVDLGRDKINELSAASASKSTSASSGASKTKRRYIPMHRRTNVDRSSLNTETFENSNSRSNKYLKSNHRDAAIRLLRQNFKGFRFEKKSNEYIKLNASDFGIRCKDVHVHVYNNKYTGSSAGIRFRFEDNTELQYNIGDGAGRDGFYLVFSNANDKRYWEVSNGLSLPKTINALLVKLNEVTEFEDSRCKEEITNLNRDEELGFFLQTLIDIVIAAAEAYQNPMAGKRGGKRKTRKRKRKTKNKTQKRKKKRKTRKRKQKKSRKSKKKR